MKKVVWLDPRNQESSIVEIIKDHDDFVLVKKNKLKIKVLPNELQSLEHTYCCPKCGNIDIKTQRWVFVNTQVLTQIYESDNDAMYCPSCDKTSYSEILTCQEYEESRD